jgi:nickel transport protein
MTKLTRIFTALLLSAAAASTFAHRVNVFAWVDGSEIVTESKFSNGNKVRGGRIKVLNEKTGGTVAEGTTDDKGELRLALPQAVLAERPDLKIVLDAGEGHRGEWTLEGRDLPGGSPAPAPAPAPAAAASASAAPAAAAPAASAAAPKAAIDEAALARLIDERLSAQLAPVKRDLAELKQRDGITVTDIVGGLGWIFGLFGVAAYFRRPGGKSR